MSTSPAVEPSAVTVAITRRVRGGNEAQMQAWVRAGTALAERFPGFLGTGWVRPQADSDEWHMLYRFADADSLAAWEASGERTWWLSSGGGLIEHDRVVKRVGIEGWFDEPTELIEEPVPGARAVVPPRWKQAVMIFTAFYPLSLLATLLLTPHTLHWFTPVRVLVQTAILTPLMTYFVLPFMTRLLDGWLHAPRRR